MMDYVQTATDEIGSAVVDYFVGGASEVAQIAYVATTWVGSCVWSLFTDYKSCIDTSLSQAISAGIKWAAERAIRVGVMRHPYVAGALAVVNTGCALVNTYKRCNDPEGRSHGLCGLHRHRRQLSLDAVEVEFVCSQHETILGTGDVRLADGRAGGTGLTPAECEAQCMAKSYCASYVFSRTGCGSVLNVSGAEGLQESMMGLYAVVPEVVRGGRPVYRNGNGQYLFKNSNGRWMMGANYSVDNGGLHSLQAGVNCPADSVQWNVWTSTTSAWRLAPAVSVTCASCTGRCELWSKIGPTVRAGKATHCVKAGASESRAELCASARAGSLPTAIAEVTKYTCMLEDMWAFAEFLLGDANFGTAVNLTCYGDQLALAVAADGEENGTITASESADILDCALPDEPGTSLANRARVAAFLGRRERLIEAAPPHGSRDETLVGMGNSGYRGAQTRSRSGAICQRWDAQAPHTHEFDPMSNPGGLESNYCRNPNPAEDGDIWCYTVEGNVSINGGRWEYCDPLPVNSTVLTPEWEEFVIRVRTAQTDVNISLSRFSRVMRGTCSTNSNATAIHNASECAEAAAELGLSDTTVSTSTTANRPEGCYWLNGELFMNTNVANRGHGADDTRHPICKRAGRGSILDNLAVAVNFTIEDYTRDPRQCRCSGRIDSSGAGGGCDSRGSNGKYWCYTDPGACDDSIASEWIASEWSNEACNQDCRCSNQTNSEGQGGGGLPVTGQNRGLLLHSASRLLGQRALDAGRHGQHQLQLRRL